MCTTSVAGRADCLRFVCTVCSCASDRVYSTFFLTKRGRLSGRLHPPKISITSAMHVISLTCFTLFARGFVFLNQVLAEYSG